jgi:hypothetical protein
MPDVFQTSFPLAYAEPMISYTSLLLFRPFDCQVSSSRLLGFSNNTFDMTYLYPRLYFHKMESVPKSLQDETQWHTNDTLWFLGGRPIFHLGDEEHPSEVFIFLGLLDTTIGRTHFQAVLDNYISSQFKIMLYPYSFHRVSMIDAYLVNSFHPYVLLYYKMFLPGNHPEVLRLRQCINELITFMSFHRKVDFFNEFAHWCIDVRLNRPGPIELLGLDKLLPHAPSRAVKPQEYVYVIRQQGGSLVKIGKTTNYKARLKNLQTGSGILLTLEYLWAVDNSSTVEKDLHMVFKALHHQGEWFRFSHVAQAELLAHMQQYQRIEI